MRKLTSAAVMLGAIIAAPASATIMYDQNVTNEVIFGSGNANGSYTVDQANGIELGLRGKLRHNAGGAPENTFNSNGDGTYSFNAIVGPGQSSPTAEWSFEWSINSNFDDNGAALDQYTYVLSIDKDPSSNIDMLMFDPINGINGNTGTVFWDHSIGNNSTANGAGVEASGGDTAQYASLIANNNLAQNSWKPHWFLGGFGFDPTLDATYDFSLSAFTANGDELASTSMQIIVGAGAKIPEPSSIALLALGAFGLVARRKFAK